MQRMPWVANHGSEQPCRILIYDTETYATPMEDKPGMFAHRLRLGVAQLWTRDGLCWSKTRHWRFDTNTAFWNGVYECCRAREPLWVYAHNASFDAAIVRLWDEIDNGRLMLRSPGRTYIDKSTGLVRTAKEWQGRLAVDGLPFIVEARSTRGSLVFVDTMNYLPVSLDAIGGWVGIKKVALPDQGDPEAEWYKRCEKDVEITASCVMKLLGLWAGRKLGTWQQTIAGLAYSCFRHICPDNGIVAHGDKPATAAELASYWCRNLPIPMDAYDVSRLERRAYYGARVVVAFQGDVMPAEWMPVAGDMYREHTKTACVQGPVTCFDVNGLYAYCMRAYEYPTELLDTFDCPAVGVAYGLARDYPCIADVRIKTDRRDYPARDNGRTVFVRGSFVTTLAGPELVAAFQAGDVDQVHSIAVYHAGRPFVPYVDYWWAFRDAALAAGDDCSAKLAKGMYTALFGKLGQRRPVWQTHDKIQPPLQWGPFLRNLGDGKGFTRFRAVAGVAQYQAEQKDCRHTFTAAAAFVTAYARRFMDSVRQGLPPRSMIYQDTDSLFCLPAATERMYESGLVHPTVLGKFKSCGSYDFVSIFGAKNYSKGGEDVVAGKVRGGERVGVRAWRQLMFERCNSIIARKPDGTVHQWSTVFAPSGSTPGAAIGPDGWTASQVISR